MEPTIAPKAEFPAKQRRGKAAEREGAAVAVFNVSAVWLGSESEILSIFGSRSLDMPASPSRWSQSSKLLNFGQSKALFFFFK
nr:hypothetical protein Itr_chr01CG15510 [Ipomoea trifida]